MKRIGVWCLGLVLAVAGCSSTGGGGGRGPGQEDSADLAPVADAGLDADDADPVDMKASKDMKPPAKDLSQSGDDLAIASPDLAIGAPVIELFAVQVATVSQNDTIVFDVSVTHPNGAAKIASVELRSLPVGSETTPASYGNLETLQGWNMRDWPAINAGRALDFKAVTTRSFYLVATDVAGHQVESDTVDVGFLCGYNIDACGGVCGGCGQPYPCTYSADAAKSCDQICATSGHACVSCGSGRVLAHYDWAQCGGEPSYFSLGSCSEPISTYSVGSYGVGCCCR